MPGIEFIGNEERRRQAGESEATQTLPVAGITITPGKRTKRGAHITRDQVPGPPS